MRTARSGKAPFINCKCIGAIHIEKNCIAINFMFHMSIFSYDRRFGVGRAVHGFSGPCIIHSLQVFHYHKVKGEEHLLERNKSLCKLQGQAKLSKISLSVTLNYNEVGDQTSY